MRMYALVKVNRVFMKMVIGMTSDREDLGEWRNVELRKRVRERGQ